VVSGRLFPKLFLILCLPGLVFLARCKSSFLPVEEDESAVVIDIEPEEQVYTTVEGEKHFRLNISVAGTWTLKQLQPAAASIRIKFSPLNDNINCASEPAEGEFTLPCTMTWSRDGEQKFILVSDEVTRLTFVAAAPEE
jgi:hypothetical protein